MRESLHVGAECAGSLRAPLFSQLTEKQVYYFNKGTWTIFHSIEFVVRAIWWTGREKKEQGRSSQKCRNLDEGYVKFYHREPNTLVHALHSESKYWRHTLRSNPGETGSKRYYYIPSSCRISRNGEKNWNVSNNSIEIGFSNGIIAQTFYDESREKCGRWFNQERLELCDKVEHPISVFNRLMLFLGSVHQQLFYWSRLCQEFLASHILRS